MPDTILNTTSTTSVLATNGTNHTSTIDTAGDQDWWGVTLTANTLYQFRLTGTGPDLTKLADPYLNLLSSTGALLRADDNSGGGRSSLVTYAPAAGGTYYVSAQGVGTYTGDYVLTATQISTSALVANGSNYVGTIGLPAETDWWKVTLTADTTYDLRLTGNGLADPYLSLLSSTGSLIAGNDDANSADKNSLITYTPTTTGTYYLSTQGYANNIGDYILTATARAVSADSIAATTSTGSNLTVNAAASTGTIETATDTDWWRVSLDAGTTYEFRMETNTGVAANQQLRDTYLRLLESDGDQITFNDDNGARNGDNSAVLNSLIRYTPGTTGTYFLSAEGFNGLAGAYTIRATSIAATTDTIAAGNTTTSSITVGGAAGTGIIDYAGDRDAWGVSLTAGNSYQFRLDGTTLTDTYLRLLNSSGGEIMANDDAGGGLNSMITYTPTSNGTYYLVAAGFGNLIGSYSVSATNRGAAADIAATTLTTSSITVNGAAGTSTIGMAGDTDWWKVSLTQGVQYRFLLEGTSLADPYLRLMDTAGLEIDVDDDSGSGLNAQIYYTAATTGDYYLSAQGFGADTGEYSLTAITDIDATMATSAVIAVGGAAGTSSIGSAGDYDWWKVSLTNGTQYKFTLNGANVDGKTLIDPFLRLMDPLGAQIAYDNDTGPGLNAEITFTATTTGVHYLSAEGIGTGIGGYTLTAFSI